MKKFLSFFLCLTLLASLAGCAAAQNQNSDVIVIGSVHPLTGSMAYEGQALVNAQELAIEEINNAGGIRSLGGKKLKLEVMDSQGTANLAASSVQKLASRGVTAITGTYTSSTAMTATQEAEKAKVPFVVTVASATELMERNFHYSFRIQPNVDTYCQDFIDYFNVIKTDTMKTVAILHEDSTYGTAIAQYIQAHIGETGLKVVGAIAYPATTSSLSAEITRLVGLAPDVFIPVGYYSDQSIMFKELVERSISFPLTIGVANGAFCDPKFLEEFGGEADGILDVNYRYNPKSEKTRAMQKAYREKYGEDIPVHAIYAYESIYVLADALERAGSDDRDALRDALAATALEGHVLSQGTIEFDETGENRNAASVLVQVQGGKQVIVYPAEYAEAEIVLDNK